MRLVAPRVNHDAHCHVADFADALAVINAYESAEIDTVCVTVHPAQFDALTASGLVEAGSRVRVVPGLHPAELPAAEDQLSRLLELIDVAPWVGEIGLDGVDDALETQASQRRVLSAVLEACVKRGEPEKRLSLHSRRTSAALLAMLDGYFPGAVLHWFSGDAKTLERAITERRWFSVNPAMAASRTGRQMLRELPRDRVVYESDGPYAWCSGRPARPSDSGVVVTALASLWEMREPEVAGTLNVNWSMLNGRA
ncbi:MAG: TatD family hydrolase [Planctomycetota bacterium]